MIGLIQRVDSASVAIDGHQTAEIERGILLLAGFVRRDDAGQIGRFLERVLNYRIFPDSAGRMNRSLRDIDGGLLVVPQFTLAADTNSGNRPSFTPAATPEQGRQLFEGLCELAAEIWPNTGFGVFGANMQVTLVNDGPVTFWLEG
ncbi:MAG: D-aminoacyl-tRNA deacylase [Wenzhouxiangellaceae bacterium]|nr:D-aminoacyl-tRNA deacylase [Wenzhouxiangellaceae bacterium]